MNKVLESIEDLRKEVMRVAGNRCFDMHVTVDAALSWLDEIEQDITEHYVPLPVDADGIKWKYDDHAFISEDGRELTLTGMRIDIAGEWDLHAYASWHKASLCRHVKPRTVEEVLYEFGNESADNGGADPDDVVKYADELRELLGGEI